MVGVGVTVGVIVFVGVSVTVGVIVLVGVMVGVTVGVVVWVGVGVGVGGTTNLVPPLMVNDSDVALTLVPYIVIL